VPGGILGPFYLALGLRQVVGKHEPPEKLPRHRAGFQEKGAGDVMKNSPGYAAKAPTRPRSRTPERSGPGLDGRPKNLSPPGPMARKTVERSSGGRVVTGRRPRNPYTAIAVGGLAAVVITTFVLVSVLGGKGSHTVPPVEGTYRLPATVLSELNEVAVGALVNNATAADLNQVTPPETLPPNAPPLSSNGRPEIIYIGAQFCTSCAGERWALVIALSKFGMFKNLRGTTSSYVYPGGPTFSFYGATYSSKYLSFVTDEQSPRSASRSAGSYENVLTLSDQEHNIMTAWDVAPYAIRRGSVPFLDLGGKFVLSGFQYDADAVWQMSFQAAASVMTSSTTAVSKQVEAAAGFLVEDLCTLTHEQPGPVCSHFSSRRPL
jgi:Domain of unknown function (DUF929)